MSEWQNGIGWFEIGTDDVGGTEAFYGSVFGWRFSEQAPYRKVSTPAKRSIEGGVFATGGHTPNYATFYIVVDDVPATCAAAEAAGGKVLVPAQDGDNGLVFAHLSDPTGNHIAVYSPQNGKDV
ncbi:VOC family protein [Longispora sp. NPDC051575]|uniref:VOC family protein n=1 Tax=Longispora sp. NPDC051575 TaxID=3154943 RepID=UPI0034307A1B